jgi:hypothetical protein
VQSREVAADLHHRTRPSAVDSVAREWPARQRHRDNVDRREREAGSQAA